MSTGLTLSGLLQPCSRVDPTRGLCDSASLHKSRTGGPMAAVVKGIAGSSSSEADLIASLAESAEWLLQAQGREDASCLGACHGTTGTVMVWCWSFSFGVVVGKISYWRSAVETRLSASADWMTRLFQGPVVA
jgi:hypothetical protein